MNQNYIAARQSPYFRASRRAGAVANLYIPQCALLAQPVCRTSLTKSGPDWS